MIHVTDPEEVAHLLQEDLSRAMLPLANLRAHGVAGHPRAMTFWRHGDAILGCSEEGVAFPLFDTAPPGLSAASGGRRLIRAVGPFTAVTAFLGALDLTDRTRVPVAPEPHFSMDLGADLTVPEGPGRLVPVSAAPRIAARWRAAYESELSTGTGAPADETVRDWMAADSHRVLVDGDTPLALTGFNAVLPQIVQVGGVYVPPELRRKRLARRAVALHLAEARDRGVREATLFAATAHAAAAYAAIGFRRIGEFALANFAAPVMVAA